MLSKTIESFIRRNNLLGKDGMHLVALSGGADSVCLLLIMRELGYHLHAAHCNFRLRGDESNRDEDFCVSLCKKLDVPIHRIHFDTRAYASLHKVSIEMAARELRYSYFEQLRQDIGAEDILVAHHRDDNVETLLLNLVRGTGVSGLAAIRPRNGHVVRPLLAICRKDIENYLTLHHQSYVTDSTNAIDDVLRNKIRLNVIPLLEEVNPAAVSNISKTIENVAEALKVIDDSIARSISKCTERQGDILNIDVEKLRLQPSAEQVLFAILSPCSFSSAQIRQIAALNAEVGRLWHSATHTLAVDRNRLLLAPRIVHDSTLLLNIPETGNYTLIDNNVRARITVEIAEKDTGFQASKDPNIVTLDAEKVSFPLLLRHVVDGDAFVPYGMKGRKLVSDYLTDRKRNYFQKQSQLVVEDASGRIAWLVGERTSAHAAVDADTIKILVLRYSTDE